MLTFHGDRPRKNGWLCCLGLLGAVVFGLGCDHLPVRVETPALPEPPSAENDLIRGVYIARTPGSTDGRGVVAVRVTNKTDAPLTLRGNQDASIPAKDGADAWLVYRGHEHLTRFTNSQVEISLQGGEADVSLDIPEEGASRLEPGQSRTILIGYELPENVRDLAIDVSPLVASDSVHSPEGELRALYLTIPIRDQPSLGQQAKDFMEQTRFGIQLSSDDFN